MDVNDYMTVVEAAAAKGVTRAAIYSAIKNGRLKPVTILGHIALQRVEVEAYVPLPVTERKGAKLGTWKVKRGRPRKTANAAALSGTEAAGAIHALD